MEQLTKALYIDATKRTPGDAFLLKPREYGRPGLNTQDAHHFLQMLLKRSDLGNSESVCLVENTAFSINSTSVARCTCGAKGRPESEIDIGLIVPLDVVSGNTLVGQLDQLVREEPIVWKCA